MTLVTPTNILKGMTVTESYISPLANRFYNDRLSDYLNQGLSPLDAAERADMDLLQWSNPPVDEFAFDMDEDAIEREWMGEELEV